MHLPSSQAERQKPVNLAAGERWVEFTLESQGSRRPQSRAMEREPQATSSAHAHRPGARRRRACGRLRLGTLPKSSAGLDPRRSAQRGLVPAARRPHLHPRPRSTCTTAASAVRSHRRELAGSERSRCCAHARARQGGVAKGSPARGVPGSAHARWRRSAHTREYARAQLTLPTPPFPPHTLYFSSAPPLPYSPEAEALGLREQGSVGRGGRGVARARCQPEPELRERSQTTLPSQQPISSRRCHAPAPHVIG